MTKKKAIILVLVVEVLVYLFILVGLPTLENVVGCEAAGVANLPWLLKVMPGLIGVLFLVLICKQKTEVKDE